MLLVVLERPSDVPFEANLNILGLQINSILHEHERLYGPFYVGLGESPLSRCYRTLALDALTRVRHVAHIIRYP